jgi:hypothetical protein
MRSRVLLLIGALALCLPQRATSQGQSIRIRDFGALLTVHTDGTMDVLEQLTIGFTGEWHGINRDISLHHSTARGRPTKLDIQVGNVTDGNGNPLRVEESTTDNGWTRSLKIYVPDAIDADRKVIIRYRVSNAIRFYFKTARQDAFDELYWNVTGNGWTMPIDSVHARVVLPDGVMPIRTAVYTGPAGSRASDAKIDQDQNEVGFTSLNRLGPYEGMTIALGWPPGYIAGRPSETAENVLNLLGWSPYLFPLIAFFLYYGHWRKKGRDPKEEAIVVRYEPVKGMSPAELGTLVDNTADMEDITATLVDLAVRGFVHITELTQAHLLGLVKKTDYRIDILRKRNEWSVLKPHEQSYLNALGESAPLDEYSMKVSELQNRFYKYLPDIKNAIYDSLVAIGYYLERPDKSRAKAVGFSVLGMFVIGGVAILTFSGHLTLFEPRATLISAAITIVILLMFARIMPARTVAGARARESALGFKEFLSRVEEERFKKMITSPAMFEKYLPYAMAFGVADKWASAFKDIYREPPQWYSGGTGAFNAMSFSQSIGNFSSAASSSMGSSPGSSGSGGGGSSGGGSGGGGGSGF